MSGQKIGRFEILRELGRGGQGTVYLARDSQLDRQVAIKTLRKSAQQTNELMNEARIVSKLQHPNIITLFDCGEQQSVPYLVYAYVAGQTLAQLLKEEGKLPALQAAEIACGMLDGLACAHEQQIVHLDVKPANVMIDPGGRPMVMDFGLARVASEQGSKTSGGINGSPRYLAPEQLNGMSGSALSDIYAVGTIMYEMVTGKFAVPGENLYEVLNRAANEPVIAPSRFNDQLDAGLESIILKALSKKPADRYESAEQMKQAIKSYLGESDEAQVADSGAENSTLEFLLRRMRTKKDFPAISGSIAEINRIVASESSSGSRLASVILQDFSLTSKLLKLVNAATYGQFGGKINTVSKAVVVVGFETVRSIASSLILVDFLQNKPQASQLREEISSTILASVVAAQLAVGQNVRDAEEVMVCAMFHSLGRLLATYYFFDESQEVKRLVEKGENEDKAAYKILGITYSELGLGVARSWNFSDRITTCMERLHVVQPAKTELDNMAITVNLANELCDIACTTKPQHKAQQMEALSKRYGAAFKISEKQLSQALEKGVEEFAHRSAVLGIKLGKSAILDKVRNWNGAVKVQIEKVAQQYDELSGEGQLEQTLVSGEDDAANETGMRPANPEMVLGAGIQDVTNSLVSEFKLNDVLMMILETIYRGMGFNRAVLLIRDNKSGRMVAKYGFGDGVEQIMPHFHFSLNYEPDVFHLAVARGLDIAIEDTHAPNIEDKVPQWFWTHINAPCFLLLPAMVKEKAICMFYADMQKVNGLNTSKQQLSLLRTLRNQAVLAIKQKI